MTNSSLSIGSSSTLLRRALQVDAAFSGAGGLVLCLAAGALAPFMGLPSPLVLIVLGIGLVGYALIIYRIAMARPPSRAGATGAVILNTLWVIGSAVLLLSNRVPLTPEGRWLVVITADMVGMFAVAQFVSLRRMVRGSMG